MELIDISDYLGAQCCAWVRRAVALDDLWKINLFVGSYGNIFNLRQRYFDQKISPILHNISGYFENFIYCFTAKNENFRTAYIFDNPCLKFENRRPHHLKKSFFTEMEWETSEYDIKHLKFEMLVHNNTVRTKEEFEVLSGITVSNLRFAKLRGIANTALQNFCKVTHTGKRVDSVKNFCMRNKRGSKRLRSIISKEIYVGISQNICKFADITETIINEKFLKLLNCSWGFNYLPNSTRTFIYKLHNNILGINTRVSHFVRNNPRTCTFCDLREEPDENLETISHLFFNCPQIENTIQEFYVWIFNEDRFVNHTEFFVGFSTECEKKNNVLHIVNLLVKKFIWDCKLRFTVPSYMYLKKFVISELNNISNTSPKMKNLYIQSALFDHIPEISF